MPGTMTETFRLHCGDVLVGRITNAFVSDDTWFGICEVGCAPGQSPRGDRVLQFIAFSTRWHARLECNSSSPLNASGFDEFSDLIAAGEWSVTNDEGDTCSRIVDAPVFYGRREITWRLAGDV